MTRSHLRRAFAERERHLSPFFVLGDPNPALSVDIAVAAVEAGATMLELGFAYGDPVADGPAVQGAARRALGAGTTVSSAFDVLGEIRARVDVPLNLLVYGNLVHARGFDRFARDAARAGASSLLVPDVPLEESEPLRVACAAAELGFVHLVGPATPPERARRLADAATAFLYVAGHQGITGAFGRRGPAGRFTVPEVELPLAVGFGLRTADDVHDAFAAGARIAVVGSAFASRIEEALEESPADARRLPELVAERVRALARGLSSPHDAVLRSAASSPAVPNPERNESC